MPYSLWRGDTQLGDVVARLPTGERQALFGLFRPLDSFADLSRVMQVRLREVPGSPVIRSRFTGAPNPGSVPLRQASPEDVSGLPPSEQLQLRDEQGLPVHVDSSHVHSEAVPHAPGEFPDLCRSFGFDDTVWVLMADPLPDEQPRGG